MMNCRRLTMLCPRLFLGRGFCVFGRRVVSWPVLKDTAEIILILGVYRSPLASFSTGQVSSPTRPPSCDLESLAHHISIWPASANVIRHCLPQQSKFHQRRRLFCHCSSYRRAHRNRSKLTIPPPHNYSTPLITNPSSPSEHTSKA